MINRENKIKCDNCGLREYFLGNFEDTKGIAKSYGWVIKGQRENERHFCNIGCYNLKIKEEAEENLVYDPKEVIPIITTNLGEESITN